MLTSDRRKLNLKKKIIELRNVIAKDVSYNFQLESNINQCIPIQYWSMTTTVRPLGWGAEAAEKKKNPKQTVININSQQLNRTMYVLQLYCLSLAPAASERGWRTTQVIQLLSTMHYNCNCAAIHFMNRYKLPRKCNLTLEKSNCLPLSCRSPRIR